MSAVDLEVGKADFDFYAKFAKPLILSLVNTEDRILASAWFSKLRDEASGPEKLRLDYLKLLLFVLQRHRLAGPFTENPNIEETLQTFGDNYDLPTIARQIIEKEQQEKKETYYRRIRGEIGDFAPYSTDYSPDLREYVAAQDIPNFGVHVYYAISKDPILDWDNAHHAVFPKAVRRMEPQGHLSETSFAVMEPKDETEEVDKCKILEETGVMPDESIFLGQKRERERKSPFVYMDRPAPALGILPGEGEEEVLEEELPPPTWGSNLIEVREPIDMDRPDTAAEQAAIAEAEVTGAISEAGMGVKEELDPDDLDVVNLLETSFNMEDILAEVDAIETEDLVPDFAVLEDDSFEAAEHNFREVEDMLNKQDALIAEAMAELSEDELTMLARMEQEDEEAKRETKPEPRKEVKILADDDTVIKVLVEEPGAKKETAEEKKRKAAKKGEDKKKKPAGRTGLNKAKAKGAILKESEKKALEKEEKRAKVVATKTGKPAAGPAKRPGVPKTKPTTSKTKVVETASTGKIPSAKSSDTGVPKTGIPRPPGTGIPKPGTGIPKPGTGIPRPGGTGIPRPGGTGIPRPGGTGIPRPGGIPRPSGIPQAGQNHMDIMRAKLQKMQQEAREAFPEEFPDEAVADLATPGRAAPEEARRGRLSPIHEVSMSAPMSPGSPESDDIFEEMEREYKILERLYQLYDQLAPDQPEGLRTPPVFSKNREIKELGRQMRYRADEFDIHPAEQFVPAEQFFAEEGRGPPSPFADPRDAGRTGDKDTIPPDIRDPSLLSKVPSPVAAAPVPSPPRPEVPPPKEETPPWAAIEELKKIAERAERRVDISPAISGGIALTTPQSPATPKRPAKRDLRFEFDMESPPPYDSPKTPMMTPPPVTTPEFIRIKSYGLPGLVTEEELEKMYLERKPEYDAYIRAEIAAEREKWGRFAPRSPGASPEMMPSSEPAPGIPSPRPGPSQPPGPSPQQQRTPEQLPPEYRYQYETPPRMVPPARPEIPGQPVFEEFDPLQHEDIIYQTAPDLVEAEFEEFEQAQGSPQFELKEWYDPFTAIAETEQFDIGLDVPDEMMMDELMPFEEPPPTPPSPMAVLRQQLREHEIPPEFRDKKRPDQKSKKVLVGTKGVKVKRKSKPTRLAKQTIEEDYSGEVFEKDEELMEEEAAREQEQKFMEMVIDEDSRVEHLQQMIESAGEGEVTTEEEQEVLPGPPSQPPSPFRSPIRTPERPVKPVATPPLPPSRDELMYGGTPERFDTRPIYEEEAEFLASPGFPSPTPPSPPPVSPGLPSPPWAPPREMLMWESPPMRGQFLVDEEMDDFMLASPGMSPGRTMEEEFRELGTPTRLPPPFWTLPPPGPPSPPPVSPQRMMPQPVPGMPESPEIDAAALRRELRDHEVQFRKAPAGGFRAGTRWVGRRSARNYQLIPLGEHLDYEGSLKMPSEFKDHHILLHKLPPGPMPAPYPSEMMGVQREGKFYYPDTLIDQPIPYEVELPMPIDPAWQVHGWKTPPRLRTRPFRELTKTPPDREINLATASHGRDILLFEEPPEGIYIPPDDEVLPLELMGEGLVTPPRRQMPTPTSPPRPQFSPRMTQPSPPLAIPSMTMDQQMMQAAQMAQWQTQRIVSPPRPASPERRIPSPPRRPAHPPAPHWSPQPGPSRVPHEYPYAPPPSPRQPYPPAPHWSPQAGPSSVPHVYPYAPPSPPRQPSAPPRQPSPPMRESPVRQTATRTPTQRPEPVSPLRSEPRITKRVTEVKYTSQFFDPDSPETSKKWTKGRTMLEFNRPVGDQRPVQTPPPQGVAVYGRGAPASAAEYGPVSPMPQMGSPERAPQRRPLRFAPRDPLAGDTPKRKGGALPRRRILQGEIEAEDRMHRRNLVSEFLGEEPPEPVPLSPVGERIEVMEEFEETEHDFIPLHLRGFKWMDAPADDYYSTFRQQFQQ